MKECLQGWRGAGQGMRVVKGHHGHSSIGLGRGGGELTQPCACTFVLWSRMHCTNNGVANLIMHAM